jgi:hypothetical protein
MAGKLVDGLDILVAIRRFPSLGAANSRSLRFERYTTCMNLYGGLHMPPSVDSLGTCVVSSCNVFLWFFIAHSIPIFVIPCKRVAQVLLPASAPPGSAGLGFFAPP